METFFAIIEYIYTIVSGIVVGIFKLLRKIMEIVLLFLFKVGKKGCANVNEAISRRSETKKQQEYWGYDWSKEAVFFSRPLKRI